MTTFSQMQEPGGHTLYCATTATGFQSCIMDEPHWWDQLKSAQTAAQIIQAPTPAPFVAFNTRETRTGGGGAVELMILLSVMAIRRCRST